VTRKYLLSIDLRHIAKNKDDLIPMSVVSKKTLNIIAYICLLAVILSGINLAVIFLAIPVDIFQLSMYEGDLIIIFLISLAMLGFLALVSSRMD
jgi:hypothetical protein